MLKKISALLLCILMIIPMLVSCGSSDFEDVGPYITMYLSDEIYDFDPINAYYNTETRNVVSLMFDTLFTLDKNGNVKKSLAESYKVIEDEDNREYSMEITLKDTYWSNGTKLSSEDVCFAWKRLLNSANTYEAAALLYDVKNARAVKNGDASIDDIGVEAASATVVKITFEGKIDYKQFLINLTSLATAPLLESYVSKTTDWAKKPSTIVTSGPFKLSKIKYSTDNVTDVDGNTVSKTSDDYATNEKGIVSTKTTNKIQKILYFRLDRNIYYDRDLEHDKITASVTPAQILVDCSKSAEEILADYNDGKLFYIGDIPLSIRNEASVKKAVKTSDALSTFVAYFNTNANVKCGSGTEKLFDNVNVRKALSMVIDRNALAEAVVYASAATALVPNGIFENGSDSKDFRKVGGALISTSANVDGAKALLSEAGITPSKYSFSVMVSWADDVQVYMAKQIVAAWQELGFKVTLKYAYTIVNNDYYKEIEGIDESICDNQFIEYFKDGNFEVALFDYTAYTADAFSMLAPLSTEFSGTALVEDGDTFVMGKTLSGYTSGTYNLYIKAAYYVPYYATMSVNDADYEDVKMVFDHLGLKASTKESDWKKQKSKILHEAEKVLMEDMAIIPIVFNKNAVLQSKKLSKVTSTYYAPSIFQKTKLRGYKDFYYTETVAGTSTVKTYTIFDKFPTIAWDKVN